MRSNILFTIFLILPISFSAQNNNKIDKKLSKLYNNGKYQKCYSKAQKINQKYPISEIPEFYLAKTSFHLYTDAKQESKNKYKHLAKAVNYSSKLSTNYAEFKNTVRDSLRSYVIYAHDSIPHLRNFKTAHKFYSKVYKDTLRFAAKENFSNQIPAYEFAKNMIDSLRLELVTFAEMQDGIAYAYAGEKPETGFDCSGFTKYVYSHIGIEIPHNAHKQSGLEGNNKTLDMAKPGDLIFFGSQGEDRHYTIHAGIVHTVFEDDIKVIHCVSGGVSIDGRNSSWEHYWKDKVLFVKTLTALENDEN